MPGADIIVFILIFWDYADGAAYSRAVADGHQIPDLGIILEHDAADCDSLWYPDATTRRGLP